MSVDIMLQVAAAHKQQSIWQHCRVAAQVILRWRTMRKAALAAAHS
jgi:hypothetical protein